MFNAEAQVKPEKNKNGASLYDSYSEATLDDQRFFFLAPNYLRHALNKDWEKATTLIVRSPETVSIQYRGKRIGRTDKGKIWSRWGQIENFVFRFKNGKLNLFYMHRKSVNVNRNQLGYKKLQNISQKSSQILNQLTGEDVPFFIAELEALYERNNTTITETSSNVAKIFDMLKSDNNTFTAVAPAFAACITTLIYPIFNVAEFTDNFVDVASISNTSGWENTNPDEPLQISNYSSVIPQILDPQLLYKKSIAEIYDMVTYKGEKKLRDLLQTSNFDFKIINYLSLTKTLVSQEERLLNVKRMTRGNKKVSYKIHTRSRSRRNTMIKPETPVTLKQLRYLVTHASKSSVMRSKIALALTNQAGVSDTSQRNDNFYYPKTLLSAEQYSVIREIHEAGGNPFKDLFNLKILTSNVSMKNIRQLQEELVYAKTKKAHKNWIEPESLKDNDAYECLLQMPFFPANDNTDVLVLSKSSNYVFDIAKKHNIYFTFSLDMKSQKGNEYFLIHKNAYKRLTAYLMEDLERKLNRLNIPLDYLSASWLLHFCNDKQLSRLPSWVTNMLAMRDQGEKLSWISQNINSSYYSADLFDLALISPLEIIHAAYPKSSNYNHYFDDF